MDSLFPFLQGLAPLQHVGLSRRTSSNRCAVLNPVVHGGCGAGRSPFKRFVDEEHIYPGVDLGVADLLEDESLLIMGNGGYAAAIWAQLDGSRRTVCPYCGAASLKQNGWEAFPLLT